MCDVIENFKVKRLKKNNYNVYILSDNNREVYNYYRNSELFKDIDGWVLSCDYGTIKRDGKLFDIILDKFSLNPSECYFIDDNEINVNEAKKHKIEAFIYNYNEGNDKLYVVVDLVEEDQIKGAETHYDFVNFFDTYVNEEGTNTLLVLYNSKYLVRCNAKGHSFSNYYEYDMDTFKVSEVSKEDFANFLTDGMINVIINTYGWYAALYTIIIPLALTLFCFIIFKYYFILS